MDIEKWSDTGISKIKSVNILEEKDMQILTSMKEELQRIYEVKQIFRTETEMRYSVLGGVKYGTAQGRYWQSVREQNSMFTNLISNSCDYEKTQGEIELLGFDLEDIDKKDKRANARIKIKNAEIKQKQFNLMNLRLQAKDQMREIKLWEKLKEEIKKEGEFNINDVNDKQLETLQKRWEYEFKMSQEVKNPTLFTNAISGLSAIQNDKNLQLTDKSNLEYDSSGIIE